MKQDEKKQLESWDLITKHIKDLDVEVPEHRIQELLDFADIVRCWNRRVNLVSASDEQKIIKRHILNSLSLAFHIGVGRLSGTILDIGTGGGFPGLPLKIVNPKGFFTLVDSNQKKIVFLNMVIRNLRFERVTAINTRLTKNVNSLGLVFDTIVARAVAPLTLLVDLSRPLLAQGGKMFFLKGQDLSEEINTLTATHRAHNVITETCSLESFSSTVYNERSTVVTVSFDVH